MRPRILIAGIGNIFLGDDAFGVEVVRRLSAEALPMDVRVTDFGNRALHLAYELADGGYDETILVDSAQMGEQPGTVCLIEPDADALCDKNHCAPNAHAMDFKAVFRLVQSLGGAPGHVYVVGCEPLQLEESMGLSRPVALAVDQALALIRDKLREWELGGGNQCMS
jgi:hydrogenase maturation protease